MMVMFVFIHFINHWLVSIHICILSRMLGSVGLLGVVASDTGEPHLDNVEGL